MAETFLPYSVALARSELMRTYEGLAGGSLRAALRAQYNKIAASTSSGLVVSATSANAHSVSFSSPENAKTSPMGVQAMWSALIEMYDSIAAALPDGSTDAAIYAEMMFNLQPARTCVNDFTCLRTV